MPTAACSTLRTVLSSSAESLLIMIALHKDTITYYYVSVFWRQHRLPQGAARLSRHCADGPVSTTAASKLVHKLFHQLGLQRSVGVRL